MNLYDRRRLLGTKGVPLEWLTATGANGIATFDTNVALPMRVACEFLPVQEGSGDPSPDNVRPIRGWDGTTIGVNTRVPSEYQEVEYIESPGFCWFDITVPSNNSIVSSDIVFQALQTNSNYWYAGDGRSYTIQHEYGYYGGGWYNNGSYADYEIVSGSGITAKIHAHYNNYTRNGYIPIIWRMFGRYGYSQTDIYNVPPCRIWNASLTIDGSKAFDLIPCYRKSDGEIGMYDTVSKQFYINEGTGSFLKGDDIVDGNIHAIDWSTEAGTLYGGTLTLNEDGSADLESTMSNIASYNGETLPGKWISSMDVYTVGTTPTTGAQVVYELGTQTIYHFSNIGQLQSFLGTNNVWHDMNGAITVNYRHKQAQN